MRTTHATIRGRKRSQRERGLATLVVFALIVLVAMYVAANMRVLAVLKREVQLIEKRHSISEPAEVKPSPDPSP